jgi:hypothetical protein
MDQPDIFLEGLHGNPYFAELTEIVRAAASDPLNIGQLFRKLQVKIGEDVKIERTTLQSRLARLTLLARVPGKQAQLDTDLTGILEDWFDVGARRHLAGWALAPDPRPYIELLGRLVDEQAEILDLASPILGEDTVKMVMNSRVAYWTIKANAQAQQVRERKAGALASSPAPVPPDGVEAPGNTSASEAQQQKPPPTQDSDSDMELTRRVIAEVGIESFLAQHNLKKTSVTDYAGGRAAGRVSKPKQQEIIDAARKTAVELGLSTRTNSE